MFVELAENDFQVPEPGILRQMTSSHKKVEEGTSFVRSTMIPLAHRCGLGKVWAEGRTIVKVLFLSSICVVRPKVPSSPFWAC